MTNSKGNIEAIKASLVTESTPGYCSVEFKASGNTWGLLFAPNYVSIRKKTNNPYRGMGKDFKSIDAALAHYKSIKMQMAIIQAEEVYQTYISSK